MATLTEQDFKDLEDAARFGIRDYCVIRSLAKGEFESLENMLDRLNHSRNKLKIYAPPAGKYLALISAEWVSAGKTTSPTAHHLVCRVVFDLWDRIQFALNPDDHKWESFNPDDLQIENLSQYRDEVIEAINLMPTDVDMGKADELRGRLSIERQKAWEKYQEKNVAREDIQPLEPNGLNQDDFTNARDTAHNCIDCYETLLRYKSDDERVCANVMQLDDAWRDAGEKLLRVEEFIPLDVVQSAGFTRESAHDLSISLAHAVCYAIGRVTLPDWNPASFKSLRLGQDQLTADTIREEIENENGGFVLMEDKERGALLTKLRIECNQGWKEYQQQQQAQPVKPVAVEPEKATEVQDSEIDTKEVFCFVEDGNGYRIEGFGETYFSSNKGLGHLRKILMSNPMTGIECYDITGDVNQNLSRQDTLTPEVENAYRKELTDLNQQLEKADRNNDLAEKSRIQTEVTKIQAILSESSNVRNQSREIDTPQMKKIVNKIRGAINTAIENMNKNNKKKLYNHFIDFFLIEDGFFKCRHDQQEYCWITIQSKRKQNNSV